MAADSTEPLERQILSDARKRAEPVGRRAQRESEDVARQAAEEAERECRRILEQARQKAELEAGRVRAQAGLQAAGVRRAAQEKALLAVREDAARRLRQLVSSPDYRGILLRLASAALQAMEGRNFELVMSAQDKAAHGEGVAAALRDYAAHQLGRQVIVKVADETTANRGGLIVRTADGRQVCDQTFDARLDRLWDELREEAGGILFKSG